MPGTDGAAEAEQEQEVRVAWKSETFLVPVLGEDTVADLKRRLSGARCCSGLGGLAASSCQRTRGTCWASACATLAASYLPGGSSLS